MKLGPYDTPGNNIYCGDTQTFDLAQMGRFGVIVADPPWPYQKWSERNHGAAATHYDTLTIDTLCTLSVADLAGDNCILLLWGTWPKLPEAVLVMSAWGFEFVTGFPWIKMNKRDGGIQYGTGFWVRGCSEYVLIGRKGDVSPPSVEGYLGLMSPNLYHSHKPDSIYEIAEALPGPYLELFARRARSGWTSFGNDVASEEVLPLFIPEPEQQLQMI